MGGAYESGVYKVWNQNAPVINHAVVLVGYGVTSDSEVDGDQKYWTIRNSWSPSWGEEGYIRLARSDDDEDNCGMDTEPQTGTACAVIPSLSKFAVQLVFYTIARIQLVQRHFNS